MKGRHRVPFRFLFWGVGEQKDLQHHSIATMIIYETVTTPCKINMEPENHPTKQENHFPNLHFGGFKMFIFQGTCKLYYHIPQVQYDFSVSWTLFIWAAHPIQTILGSKSFCYVTLMYLAGPTAVTFRRPNRKLGKDNMGKQKQHIFNGCNAIKHI